MNLWAVGRQSQILLAANAKGDVLLPVDSLRVSSDSKQELRLQYLELRC